MLYHSHTVEEALTDLRSSSRGLHHIYAQGALRRHGRNKIHMTRKSLADVLLDPFVDVYVLILLIAIGLSFLLQQPVTTILLGCLVAANIGLRYYQTAAHERLLRRLERAALGDARIRRDGIEATIPTEELIPGDIVLIAKGDRIPADGRLIQSSELHINEYQLSGENDPVGKHIRVVHSDSTREERLNMVYRSTYVTAGNGVFVVTATGNDTEYGKLTAGIARSAKHSTLQRKISIATSKIVALSLITAGALLILGMLNGVTALQATEVAISIIVAAVPAILPVAFAVAVTYGLRRLAETHVLLRSLQSIEYTSMLTTLVSDKTGMLTQEHLKVEQIWHPDVSQSHFNTIAAQSVAFDPEERDPIDAAFAKSLHKTMPKSAPLTTFPFTHRDHMSGTLRHDSKGYLVVLKGAPEKILRISDMTQTEHERALHKLQSLTGSGYLVLAIATYPSQKQLSSLRKLPKRHPLTFHGFIALKQTVRPTVKAAITQLNTAGITTRMITGDHTESAYVMAHKLGIVTSRDEALDARRLAIIDDKALSRVSQTTRVFARTTPDQKYRILAALRRTQIVGTTGDGTDDIPSLIHSHIGITTLSSSALTRDAADMVLTDNQFASLPQAIQISRTVMGNIRRVFFYVMTTHLTEMTLILGGLLLALPAVLPPTHILWINLIVCAILILALATEPDSRNIMKRLPISPRASILPRYLALRMCILAGVSSFTTLALYIFMSTSHDLPYAQTIALHTLVVFQVLGAISARSDHTSSIVRFRTWSPNMYGAIAAVVVLHTLLIFSPLGVTLGIMTPSLSDLFSSTLIASGVFIATSEILKLYSRRHVRAHGRSYE